MIIIITPPGRQPESLRQEHGHQDGRQGCLGDGEAAQEESGGIWWGGEERGLDFWGFLGGFWGGFEGILRGFWEGFEGFLGGFWGGF